MRGTIEGIRGARPMAGVVEILIRDSSSGTLGYVTCEAAPTFRALANSFGGSYIGQEITYTVDPLGVLVDFSPVQEVL